MIQYWLRDNGISEEEIQILANSLQYERGHPVQYGELITDWNKKEKFSEVWRTENNAGFPVFLGDRRGDLELVEPGISFLVGSRGRETDDKETEK